MSDNTPLDELQWKSPEWIQAFGLRTDNVLEYFSQSPFFDRTSNNQVVKMQSQFNENIQLHSLNIENELKKMTGIEFVILHRREPDFWIIRKQNRLGPEKVESLSDYYIIGANIYMAPNVKDVVSTRLLSSALSLKNAMDKLQSLAQFTPSDGHTYRLEATETPALSRPRTLGNTPYSPATPTVQGSGSLNKSESLSIATIDNLFNISLKNNIAYLDEVPSSRPDAVFETNTKNAVVKPTIAINDDEQSIASVKKGKKPLKQ